MFNTASSQKCTWEWTITYSSVFSSSDVILFLRASHFVEVHTPASSLPTWYHWCIGEDNCSILSLDCDTWKRRIMFYRRSIQHISKRNDRTPSTLSASFCYAELPLLSSSHDSLELPVCNPFQKSIGAQELAVKCPWFRFVGAWEPTPVLSIYQLRSIVLSFSFLPSFSYLNLSESKP